MAETRDDTKLWHSRLGHMSQKGMELLVKKGYLDQTKVSTMELCENCIYGKAHRVSFAAGKHTTKGCLDYIHADLWGSPSIPESLGDCRYFLSLIDDYSRKVWTYFLQSKDQAFQKFCEWKALVETQAGRKVRTLRTDNGLEFCNKAFDSFCSKHGITRHKTIPYTPQQNGVAERMNRTILDKVRSLLSESGLDKSFWAEAVNTVTYLVNRSPSTAIDCKIPEEVWSGRQLSYSELRRFGCVCYPHSDEGKLAPRAKKGIFIGYPSGVKGYRIWLLEEHRVIISRNVTFNETLCYKDLMLEEKKSEEPVNNQGGGVKDQIKNQIEIKHSEEGPNKDASVTDLEREIAYEDIDSYQETSDGEEDEVEAPGLENYLLARDRARRQIKPSKRFDDESAYAEALMIAEDGGSLEPADYQTAVRDRDKEQWIEAMKEEMDSLHKNQTWILTTKPTTRKIIGSKWIFKRKPGIPGVEGPRFKARLVAKGYSQQEGIDYNEVFSPVVKQVTIRLLMSIVVQNNLELEQLDVKTTFLHGDLEEEIYMVQPEGFTEKGKEDKVCLLKKSLYGLKQSPRQWNQKFNKFMLNTGFKRSSYDNCAYFRTNSRGEYTYLLLYVDDMLVAATNMQEILELKESLGKAFEMKDLGPARKILGIDIIRDRETSSLKLTQNHYMIKVLERFKMEEAKAVSTPLATHLKLQAASEKRTQEEKDSMRAIPYMSAVGSLMYAMVGTRPDLAYPVGMVSRYMSNPTKDHWSAVKWIMRYVKGTAGISLEFKRSNDFRIRGFCDADYAADLDRRRSITGYVFQLGENAVSWKSKLQKVVALSTIESEFMALTDATKEAIWLKGACAEFGFKQERVELFCDSQSAIALAKNNVHHERTKHIDVRLYFIRDIIDEGKVEVLKIHTSRNLADMLTKIIPTSKFQELRSLLGMSEM